MKVVQINTTCGIGSTGKICVGISEMMTDNGIENYILYSCNSDGYELGIPCATNSYIKLQAVKSRLLGNYGFNSQNTTKKIIDELERIKPDIVHLHNIHGHDCNLDLLLTYFKKSKTKLVWTFHDCWLLTGYCTHFSMMKCDKWKTECYDCIQKKEYTWFFDKSRSLFNRKKRLFEGLDLTIVTPSKWLAEIVKDSFLGNYPVKVINNGIDLSVFEPVESNFREDYKIGKDKSIILGVAFDWGVRKGLDVFIELAKRLDQEKYQIVLVGTTEISAGEYSDRIISIEKTQSQRDLAKIYTQADVFLNPTREEVLGLTNIEANACGTPVVTFNSGGSPECIDSLSGAVVEIDDIDDLEKQIVRICEKKPYKMVDCCNQSRNFDMKAKYMEYVNLYESIKS
ncbi:MAG: glycosyltransferase [Ruminococcus sp.]|nr:glycosyltransferase [Ruminococcus sp.]